MQIVINMLSGVRALIECSKDSKLDIENVPTETRSRETRDATNCEEGIALLCVVQASNTEN